MIYVWFVFGGLFQSYSIQFIPLLAGNPMSRLAGGLSFTSCTFTPLPYAEMGGCMCCFIYSFPGPGAVFIMPAHPLPAERQLDCLSLYPDSIKYPRSRSLSDLTHSLAHPYVYPVLEEKASR